MNLPKLRGVSPFRYGMRVIDVEEPPIHDVVLYRARIRLCGIQFHIAYAREEDIAGRYYDHALYWLQDFCRYKPRYNFPGAPMDYPLDSILKARRTLIELGAPQRTIPGFTPPRL